MGKAVGFLESIDESAQEKLIYNIEKSKYLNDVQLFKKLTDKIWEFRAESKGVQYRILAFRTKSIEGTALVICTNGFIKKSSKVQRKEIQVAIKLMKGHLSKYR
ncbi:MAG: type II toxin-antitoxin system RelE/ParE family toxin [Bacteroidota bacterium]